MPNPSIRQSDPTHLSKVMAFGQSASPWTAADLAALWRHQLAAPIEIDPALLSPDSSAPGPVDRSASRHGSLDDLVQDPHPDIRVLRRLKEFAQAHALHPDGALPREVATLMYYLATAAALVRCGRRITQLNNDDLRRGLHTLLAFEWLDSGARQLLTEALAQLASWGDGR